MPGPLKLPRHEVFVQLVAKGESWTDAHEHAGFKRNSKNAAWLAGRPEVKARLAELQERAAERAVVTIEGLTERLLKIAEKGEGKEDAPMLSVARASLMDAAKLNGLIVDRSKVGFDLTGLSDEDLEQLERILSRTAKP